MNQYYFYYTKLQNKNSEKYNLEQYYYLCDLLIEKYNNIVINEETKNGGIDKIIKLIEEYKKLPELNTENIELNERLDAENIRDKSSVVENIKDDENIRDNKNTEEINDEGDIFELGINNKDDINEHNDFIVNLLLMDMENISQEDLEKIKNYINNLLEKIKDYEINQINNNSDSIEINELKKYKKIKI